MKLIPSLASSALASLLLFAGNAYSQQLPPACDDPQASSLVVNTINRNIRENPRIAAAAGGIRAIAIETTKELYADPAIRACEADLRRSDGVVVNGYTVEWINRDTGEFAVQLVGVDTLRARYAGKSAKSSPVGYEACIDGSASSAEMIECAITEAEQQDARLNAAYKAAMAGAGDKNTLRATQRLWIKHRDSQCAPDADAGQDAALEVADCIATLTASRAAELEDMR